MKHVAVDVAYVDLGKPEGSVLGTDVSVEITGWNLSAVGYLPLGRWEFFGGLGAFVWDGEAKASIGSVSAAVDDSGTDLSARIGGSFAVTKPFRIRAEAEAFNIGDMTSLISLGVEYRF